MRSIPYLCTMHPLLKMIREGEHRHQDFKYFLSDARKIARTLAAFANTEGGRMLVGVKDNGKITGLKHKEEEAYVVEAAAHVFCKPAVTYEIKEWVFEGKTVLEVHVPKSLKAPHKAPSENGRYTGYLRKGDENKVATALEMAVLYKLRTSKPLSFTLDSRHKRLLEVLKTQDGQNNYDVKTLSRLSLMTEKECIDVLSGLIAGGSLPHPFTHSNTP
ncbi:MAG: ATP-binding protein [Bacteroidales bacterium]|nr:ATP-binding protein [Bacteroidales bacterium]